MSEIVNGSVKDGDRWSLIPRVELLFGGVRRFAVLVPLSVSYSWFAF
jgi:hypothetical protein